MAPLFRIGVVGSGTAGLISALLLRRAFPTASVDVISSGDIGIIGVGEGSTEHWASLMKIMGWSPIELISQTDATHKVGIRFENWTESNPSYFHAISGSGQLNDFRFPMTYSGFVDKNLLASDVTNIYGLEDGFVTGDNPHTSVNQFHFDTFKLNTFMRNFAAVLGINFVEGQVKGVVRDTESGNIQSLMIDGTNRLDVDFVVDATGFRREILHGQLDASSWVSFRDYLLCDTAVAGPTSHDDSGRILPFTRSIAQDSGWIWEIPTFSRRGNGYVFSSQHCSFEQAKEILSKSQGVTLEEIRHFSFEPGYFKEPWSFNCCAIGLSSGFVEPLEATSISTTINQTLMLIQCLAGYTGGEAVRRDYNRLFGLMMDNVLDMIRLHYITDRKDTDFWVDASMMKVPDSLSELLELWQQRPPLASDFPSPWRIFGDQHFFHVAQGQNLLGKDSYSLAIDRFNQRQIVEKELESLLLSQINRSRTQHVEALKQVFEVTQSAPLWGNSRT